jgi:hypothetical protein
MAAMPEEAASRFDERRRGVALVIVLGLLLILTILAFAFAVSMRTERLASNSFLHATRARQFARTALARAMNDIDAAMLSSNLLYYPPETLATTGGVDRLDPLIFTNEAAGLIPYAARPPADAVEGVTWVNLADPDSGAVLGRYAYLAIDVSGHLDPNVIGALPRAVGTNGAEIVIQATHLLPEIEDPAAFVAARSNEWVRFETLPELWYAPGFLTNAYPQHLFPFSRFPSGYLSNGVAATPFLLHANAADYDLAALAEAFRAAGVEGLGGDPATTATNWIDYLDEDFVPGGIDGGGVTDGANCDSFCTEPVPMLNELVLSGRIENEGGSLTNWIVTVEVEPEIWYPFEGHTNAAVYAVVLRAGLILTGGVATTNPAPLRFTTSSDWPGGPPLPRTFPAGSFTWHLAGATPPVPDAVIIQEAYVEDSAGRIVDRLRPPFEIVWTRLENATNSWQAVDPRINWDWPRDWRFCGPTNSLGAINPPAEEEYLKPGRDGSPAMHVRNGPGPATAGETGFLLFGADRPWQTIRLLAPDALRVLDIFATATNTARGLVNPNSRDAAALASAAFDAPAERWPGEAAAPRADVASAQAFAQAVQAARPYTNRSDLMRMSEPDLRTALALDPAQVEGLVRNTAGLLSPRQNLFVILVAAQSVTDRIDPGTISDFEIQAEARAAVVVWRDPYPSYDATSNAVNRAFVRMLKWLE